MNNSGQGRGSEYKAYGMYVLSLLIFGTNGILVSHISLASHQIVLFRTLIGGILLTLLVLVTGGFDRDRVHEDRFPLVLGGTALGLNWVSLFEAYRLLNVSLATLIYYTGPVLALLCSPILFNEKLTQRKLVAGFVVTVGSFCISGSVVADGMNPLGLVAAMVSALLYAALIGFNKRITRTSGMQTAAIELVVATFVTFAYALCVSGLPHVAESDMPYIAAIGIINTGLAYLLYFSGIQKLSGQSVALISYIDPVSALCFSALLLHEALTPVQLLGAVLIIGGALFGEIRRTRVSVARR